MRLRLVLIAVLVLASVSSAAAAACVHDSNFAPSFGSSKIQFANNIAAASGSGTPITIKLNPASTVTSVDIGSFSASSSNGAIAVRLIPEHPDSDTYVLTPIFTLDPSLQVSDLQNLDFSFTADVSYTTSSGASETRTICLGDLTSTVAGNVQDFMNGATGIFQQLTDVKNVFDIMRVVIKTSEVLNTAQCTTFTNRYKQVNDTFTKLCLPYKDALIPAIDSGTAADAACQTAFGSTPQYAQCVGNLSSSGTDCISLYHQLLTLEKNASDACYRNTCSPVYSVKTHADAYTDPLGRSLCDGTDLSDPACFAEFNRTEGPKCPGANLTKLQTAADKNPDTLSLAKICQDSGKKSDITILKDPRADPISAVSCMCLPALDGYVGQLERLYDFGKQCVFGSGNQSLNCSRSMYSFVCDMALGSALQCGGLGYQEFSATANVFSTPDGTPVNFDNPSAASAQIENGGIYAYSGTGSVKVDTSKLAHTICESALGNKSIDWASILKYDASTTGTGGRIGKLCAPGVKLTSDCICDLSALGSAQHCGTAATGNQCVYDVAQRKATCQDYDPQNAQNVEFARRQQLSSPELVQQITSLPAGTYGINYALTGCESPAPWYVTVRSGQEQATLSSGYVTMNAGSSSGAVMRRTFSCTTDHALRIDLATTGLAP